MNEKTLERSVFLLLLLHLGADVVVACAHNFAMASNQFELTAESSQTTSNSATIKDEEC